MILSLAEIGGQAGVSFPFLLIRRLSSVYKWEPKEHSSRKESQNEKDKCSFEKVERRDESIDGRSLLLS